MHNSSRRYGMLIVGVSLCCVVSGLIVYSINHFFHSIDESFSEIDKEWAQEERKEAREKQALAKALVLESHAWERDEFGNPCVTGLIRNTYHKPLSYAEIDLNFFDNNGVQVENGMDNATNLAAGGLWRFKIVPIKQADNLRYRIVKIEGHP